MLDTARLVPMEYRAQATGRCQRQYIKKPKDAPPGWRSAIQQWIDEWVERVDSGSPFSADGLHLVEAQIDWRLISNSGLDEGIIRPVIGAGGWPLIPGSGIKGLFRRACPPQRLLRWCGSPCASGDLHPGILRFHGAWPSDESWTQGLLDVAHPQQNWQAGFTNGRESHSAFGVVSLHRPMLQIGLSCSEPDLSPAEWEEIEATLKQALRAGIGGRTCAGYGSSGRLSGDVIFDCGLEGQGPAAKLLDETAEFRPTMFRAAIRGMALRLFGGLTDERTAKQVVGRLFGSLSREEGQNVGLLATAYTDTVVDLGTYGRANWEQPIYATTGLLQWRLMRSPGNSDAAEVLVDLLAALHGLTMSLGGFGRGWRRPDHRIFKPNYAKTPIGCHWQWRQPSQLPAWIFVQSAQDLAALLQRTQMLACRWLALTGINPTGSAPWREVIQPQRMRIWTRRANDPLDAEAINWFHSSPGRDGQDRDTDSRDLKGTDLAGRVNQVGRIWNRLLPLIDSDTAESRGSGSPSPSATARAGGTFTRPGAVTARPANPMDRPGTAKARPGGGAMAPSASNRKPPAPRGEVSINVHPGAFMETLILFPEQRLSKSFIEMMDRGAKAEFQPLQW
jgi:CRISPR-associated protein Cmr6